MLVNCDDKQTWNINKYKKKERTRKKGVASYDSDSDLLIDTGSPKFCSLSLLIHAIIRNKLTQKCSDLNHY
jgi:hypothetical protein